MVQAFLCCFFFIKKKEMLCFQKDHKQFGKKSQSYLVNLNLYFDQLTHTVPVWTDSPSQEEISFFFSIIIKGNTNSCFSVLLTLQMNRSLWVFFPHAFLTPIAHLFFFFFFSSSDPVVYFPALIPYLKPEETSCSCGHFKRGDSRSMKLCGSQSAQFYNYQ